MLHQVCCRAIKDRNMTTTQSSKGQTIDLDEHISILKLVSTCADACARGCEVIRFVHQKRTLNDSSSPATDGNKDGVQSRIDVKYKVVDDPRSALTEADGASQDVIMQCLRSVWGNNLNIIGEEDEEDVGKEAKDNAESGSDDDVFDKYKICKPSTRKVDSNLLSKIVITDGHTTADDDKNDGTSIAGDSDTTIALRDVTLYVDPMDGTREFVEGRVWNVQCLIGITYKGKPVAGVMGLPFFGSSSTKDDVVKQVGIPVVCALNWDKCTFVEQLNMKRKEVTISKGGEDSWRNMEISLPTNMKAAESSKSEKSITVYTGDSKRRHRECCIDFLKTWADDSSVHMDMQIVGGCGAKILRTTARGLNGTDSNAISILGPGNCSWDTAAPTNLLFSCLKKSGLKGKCTDLFGGELVYDSTGFNVTNDLGGLVSIGSTAMEYHDKLCQEMRKDKVILDKLLTKYWDTKESSNGDTISSRGKNTKLVKARQEPQAVDVVRSEKGYVMTCEEIKLGLANQLGQEHKDQLSLTPGGEFELVGYAIPETETLRGESGTHQSSIHLHWEKTLKRKTTEEVKSLEYTPPEVVIYKRTNIKDSKSLVEFSLKD